MKCYTQRFSLGKISELNAKKEGKEFLSFIWVANDMVVVCPGFLSVLRVGKAQISPS